MSTLAPEYLVIAPVFHKVCSGAYLKRAERANGAIALRLRFDSGRYLLMPSVCIAGIGENDDVLYIVYSANPPRCA